MGTTTLILLLLACVACRATPTTDGEPALEQAPLTSAQPDHPGSERNESGPTAEADPLTVWSSTEGTRGTSNDGAWHVKYRVVDDQIPLNEEFGLEVAVFDQRTALVSSGIELHADAGMPQHRHGMLRQATVLPREDGTFLVEGMLFHMPGAWELYFDIKRGAVTERTQFDVELD